jgi:MiaB/RimO family radical SAM methylthiotransferase
MNVYNANTFSIYISTGCGGKCTYCSIKQSRGYVKSKPLNNVLREYNRGLSKGFKDFALLGTDIGFYGKDIDTNLILLLEKMIELDRNVRIRLRNVNPRWLINNSKRFLDIIKKRKGNIVYIQSPVQSGNDRVLSLMKRGYKIENYLDCIKKIRKADPSVFIKTQFLVGFPGETDLEFNDSLDLLRLKLFDYVDVFRYSNRRNTKASEMVDQVPESVIMHRYNILFLKNLLNSPLHRLKIIRNLKANR